jgi:hypothetical protein
MLRDSARLGRPGSGRGARGRSGGWGGRSEPSSIGLATQSSQRVLGTMVWRPASAAGEVMTAAAYVPQSRKSKPQSPRPARLHTAFRLASSLYAVSPVLSSGGRRRPAAQFLRCGLYYSRGAAPHARGAGSPQTVLEDRG